MPPPIDQKLGTCVHGEGDLIGVGAPYEGLSKAHVRKKEPRKQTFAGGVARQTSSVLQVPCPQALKNTGHGYRNGAA